jgi:hypothetical protein
MIESPARQDSTETEARMTLLEWIEGGGLAAALDGTPLHSFALTPLPGGRERLEVRLAGVTHRAERFTEGAGAALVGVDADPAALVGRVRAVCDRILPGAERPGERGVVWSDLPVRLLDALVPPFDPGTLAAWVDAWRPEPLEVAAGGVLASWVPAPARVSRGWADLGAVVLPAQVVWSVDGASVATAGPMRLGTLGAAGWSCRVPDDAAAVAERWREVVRRRLLDLASRAGGETMVPPWLLTPAAPLASLLAMRAVHGPPPPAEPDSSVFAGSLARAAGAVVRLADAGGAPRWALGDVVIEVDPGAGRVTLMEGDVRAVVLDAHPWEPGLLGGIDEDAARTCALVRWIGEVIRRSGTDVVVGWVARDPEGPGGMDDGSHERSVAAFLALEDPLDPVLDVRVQGFPVGATPWHAWDPAVEPRDVEAALAVRDGFCRRWGVRR